MYMETLVGIIIHDKTDYTVQSMLDKYLPVKENLHQATENTIYDVIFVSDSVNEAATKAGYKTLLPDPQVVEKALNIKREWKPTQITPSKDITKAIKMQVAFEYFLHNTSLPWFKYQDGDAYLVFDHYIRMMNYYTTIFPYPSAYTSPIIKGACTCHNGEYYIQGGTGLLISRKVVEKFMEDWGDFVFRFNTFEDQAIMELIYKMGITLINFSSTYFIGDPVQTRFTHYMTNGNYRDLPKCKTHPSTQCAPEFYYLNKVASVHRIDDYRTRIDHWIRSGAVPDNIRFYHNNYFPSLCYMDD